MATLTGITVASDACACNGGIFQSYGTDCANITDVTFGMNGEITNFVMSGMGQWVKYVYNTDDTANLAQTGSRPTEQLFEVEQVAFMKFTCSEAALIRAANNDKLCCCTVWIHFMENCTNIVQGIQPDLDCVTAEDWKFTKKNAKITPSIFTGTTAEEARVEYSITSTSTCFAPDTTLTQAAIEAL